MSLSGALLSGGGAGGGGVSGLTPGSLLFGGATGDVAQDSNAAWDNTTKKLSIVTPTSGAVPLSIRGTHVGAYSAIDYVSNDNGNLVTGTIGFGNASVALTHLRNKNFWRSTDEAANNVDIVFATNTHNAFAFSITPTAVAIEFASGTSAGFSTVNRGRLFYSAGGDQRFRVFCSNEINSYRIPLEETVLATGGVLFANSGNRIAQNTAQIVWDDSANKLHIGSGVVAGNYKLMVHQTLTGQECVYLRNTHVGGYSDMVWADNAAVQKGGVGYGNASVGNTLASRNFFYTPEIDWVMSDATVDFFRWYTSNGAVGFEIAAGAAATLSKLGTAKMIYDEATNQVKVSKNNAAYAVLI